jgi:hypothetical protein
MKPKLNRTQKRLLRQSSSGTIEVTFGHPDRFIRANKWLGSNNRYRQNCIDRLKHDCRPGRSVNNSHLSQYIAASAPLHCVDGWSLLGRAFDCHAQGDADSSRHLAYYAELRGAMSLLAIQGIGLFSRQHFTVDNLGACHLLQPQLGTHEIAWLVLEHWANLDKAVDLLSEIITPHDIPLQAWLDAFGAGPASRPIGSRWLKKWGLDLKRISDDRDARNESSYRPTHINNKNTIEVLESTKYVHDFWLLYEPSVASHFGILDRHLLRLSLEQAYEAITGRNINTDRHGFGVRIDAMLNALSPAGVAKSQLKDFFMRRINANTPRLLREASGDADYDEPHHHLQVISRAALILRIASGACARLIRTVGFESADLRFWWSPLGIERGLWAPGAEPGSFSELWVDVRDALTGLNEWQEENKAGRPSYASWLRECANEFIPLTSCERIALWGLGL